MKKAFNFHLSRRALLKIASLTSAIALVSLPNLEAHAQANKNTLIIGHTTLRHLNPAIQSGSATGVPGVQLFAGLIELDEHFEAQPYLAESWDISEDGLSYEFRLQKNAVFHDGQPITSADVAYSLDVVRDNHPFGAPMFAAVSGIETPDDHTIQLTLDYPQPALITSLSPLLLPIIPKHVYSTEPIQTHPANTKGVVGSGPFKLVEYRPGAHIIMEKHDEYFREGLPRLDRLVFSIMQDSVTSVLAMERGDVHYLPFAGMRLADITRLESNPKLKVTTNGYDALGAINYLEINHRKEPLGDIRVRQAIAHAIDKDFIVEKLLAGHGQRLDGPMTAANPFFSEDSLHVYEYDLEKAEKLLDEAGLKPNKDGIRLSVTLEWLPDVQVNSQQPVAQYLRNQLKKIGIDTQLRANPDFPTWATRVSNWEHDLTMTGSWNYPDPLIGVHRTFLSGNQIKGVIYTNTEGYVNEYVDELLLKAAKEKNPEERKKLYNEFQSIVSEELPVIWTNEEPSFTVYNANLNELPLTVWGPLGPYDKVHWNQ